MKIKKNLVTFILALFSILISLQVHPNELTIYEIKDDTITKIKQTKNTAEIAKELKIAGIPFTQFPAKHTVTEDMTNEEILTLYHKDIDIIKKKGYKTADVVSIYPEHPDKNAFREKFIHEHTHSEDEVRFFVNGQALFSMHINNKVYVFLANKNDLITVPAGTKHWFDMGEYPEFTVIRFYNNPEGWAAHYTDSDIAEKFPKLNTQKPKDEVVPVE